VVAPATVGDRQVSSPADQMRTAEVIATMCLATDLGMGFPFEHGLHATLTTMRLCEALELDSETSARTYYACLLMYAGCTVDAEERSELFASGLTENLTHRQFGSRIESMVGVARALQTPGASAPRRALDVAAGLPKAYRFVEGHFAALCEVAGMLAERLGVPEDVYTMFSFLTERWDGKSVLKRAGGEEIPLPIRIIQVGRDATYQRLIGDDSFVREVIRSRAGKAFDPDLSAVFLENLEEVLGPRDLPATVWEDVLAAEPVPWRRLEGHAIDRALGAIGAFADLVSPYLTGHSSGVAELASRAAAIHGFDESDIALVRRAGLVHDVGRTAISSRIWDKPGALDADEREQVRLHPYQTGRVLSRSAFLSGVASTATTHHERLDGSGYPRGLNAATLSPPARLLAVADSFQAKIEPRPYRHALTTAKAAEVLAGKATQGSLDPAMVAAVAEAAGQRPPRIDRPAGLTEREVEVVGLMAGGLLTKQIAVELGISPKTVDRHIQNSYRKMGVSSRAAATLFATERGLVRR
jgi:HD-GYP domain-containing protein (c-di-GMP phosphodiesterase class II)